MIQVRSPLYTTVFNELQSCNLYASQKYITIRESLKWIHKLHKYDHNPYIAEPYIDKNKKNCLFYTRKCMKMYYFFFHSEEMKLIWVWGASHRVVALDSKCHTYIRSIWRIRFSQHNIIHTYFYVNKQQHNKPKCVMLFSCISIAVFVYM